MMNPGRHRTRNPRHAANGAKPAHGPPHPDEHLVTSPRTAYQVPTYEPGADDAVRGRHAALGTHVASGNGHSADGVVMAGAVMAGTPNGAKPAHVAVDPGEHRDSSTDTQDRPTTLAAGGDDAVVHGRHAALERNYSHGNGHSADGVVMGGAANGGAWAYEANGTWTYGANGATGNGHAVEGTESVAANGNGHAVEGTESVAANGNGHEPAAGPLKVEEPEPVALPESPTAPLAASETVAAPLHGTTRIRYGAKEIGSGSGDLGRAGLERLRRHLPRRARTITLGRLALVLVVSCALVAVAAGVAVSREIQRLEGPANVVVATAAPAVIDNQPGGVGTISAAPQDVATVALNVQGITIPIEVTAVDVIANQYVSAGAPLLQFNPLPFEQNVQQIRISLEQAEQTLASARAAAANPAASGGSGNAYLAVQVPTSEGEVALDQQLLQIAEGNSTSITAPIAGYISEVRVAPGQVVLLGTTLLQIVNPTQVVVDAGMQLSDLPSVAVGDSATITPSQLPDVHLHGTVVAISAEASGDGLEGTVVVAAPNTPGQPVPIGSQSIVNIAAPVHAAVSVPTLAVLNVEIAPVVGVVQNDRIHFQPVQIGASDGNRTQILSGLSNGEVVAVTNMQQLTNGAKVSPSSGGS